ncbi:MAG: hypothetical protein AAB152_11240 [Candidatus Coatesbacteria bacterium]
MKKLFAVAVVLSLAGTASAASVAFDFGTNFYHPTASGYLTQNGQNFLVSWNLDNDLGLGVYTELSNWSNVTGTGTLAVSAISIAKGVVKNVAVGLNLGSGTTATNTRPLADIFGVVNILSGSGEKVSGALRATASARFCQAQLQAAGQVADGYSVGLSVQVGF